MTVIATSLRVIFVFPHEREEEIQFAQHFRDLKYCRREELGHY
jgi:hypothetical protein